MVTATESDPGDLAGGALIGMFLVFFGCVLAIRRLLLGASGSPHGETPVADLWPYVIDAGPLDSLRRQAALQRLIGRLIGLFWATGGIVWMYTESNRWYLVLVAVAIIGGGLIARSAPDVESTTDLEGHGGGWLRDGRRRLVGAALLAVVYATAYATIAGALGSLLIATRSERENAIVAAARDSTPQAMQAAATLLLFGGAAATFFIDRAARHITNRTMKEVIERDERPPIVFLRAFDDDGIRVRTIPDRADGLAGRFGLRNVARVEEKLAWTLSVYGPVIAVSQPGSNSRPLGATRETIDTTGWLAIVEQRVRTAQFVVVMVGHIDGHPGLRAEVEMLTAIGALDRTFFVLPPLAGPDPYYRWWSIAYLLGVDHRLARENSTPLVRVHEGSVYRYMTTRPLSAEGYAAAFQAALDPAALDAARARSNRRARARG